MQKGTFRGGPVSIKIQRAAVCRDRFHEKNENLMLLPEKVVIDALGKDINPRTNQPCFPPEILSRMSSYTVLMLNHLKADVIYGVGTRHCSCG